MGEPDTQQTVENNTVCWGRELTKDQRGLANHQPLISGKASSVPQVRKKIRAAQAERPTSAQTLEGDDTSWKQ